VRTVTNTGFPAKATVSGKETIETAIY
jgi:hypothetical protein